MSRVRAALRRAASDDAGFGLIEVIVSLVLLGMVATGALYFFIQGTATTSHIQRSQNAVAIANEAMEAAYALSPKDNAAVGAPQMVLHRTQTAVEAAWAEMGALGVVEGLADTYPVWDPTATGTQTPVLPVQEPRSHSGQDYEVTTLVGSCFRTSSTLSTDQACTRLTGHTSDPGDAATPASMVRMLRVIAVVTWKPTAGECATDLCTYQLSGLVDRSDDLEWNQIVDPVAIADFETFTQGESRPINVLANDMIGPVTSNPVLITASPPSGHGSVSVASNGTVTYTAPVGASGVFRFSYRIKDARGALSTPVDVDVTVLPESSNDTFDVVAGTTTTLPVTANDRGTPASVTLVGGPTSGSASVDGLGIRYTPAVPNGFATLRYRYTDVAGQESPEATVTVRIETLNTTDTSATVAARNGWWPSWTDLTGLLKAGNADPSRLDVVITDHSAGEGLFRFDGAGSGSVGGGRGRTVEFSPDLNVIGEHTVRYRLETSSGAQSEERTLTLRVVPVAVNDDAGNLRRGRTHYVKVLGNDAPATVGGTSNVAIRLGEDVSCGDFAAQDRLHLGEVRIRTVDSNRGNCSFTYELVGTGAWSHLRSAPATVSFRTVER